MGNVKIAYYTFMLISNPILKEYTNTLVIDSPQREDVRDDHRLVGGRVDALDPLGVEVLEQEFLPDFPPEMQSNGDQAAKMGTVVGVTITAAELTQPMALLIAQHYAYKLVLVPAKEVGGAVGVEYYGRHRLRRRLRHDEPRRDGLRDSTVQDHKLGSVKSDTVLYDILTLIRNGNSVTVRFCHNTKTFYFKCFLISTHVIVKCKKKI